MRFVRLHISCSNSLLKTLEYLLWLWIWIDLHGIIEFYCIFQISRKNTPKISLYGWHCIIEILKMCVLLLLPCIGISICNGASFYLSTGCFLVYIRFRGGCYGVTQIYDVKLKCKQRYVGNATCSSVSLIWIHCQAYIKIKQTLRMLVVTYRNASKLALSKVGDIKRLLATTALRASAARSGSEG